MRTNDAVLLSFVSSLLEGAGIAFYVADEAFSSVEGSLAIFPRRVLVADDEHAQARRLLVEAGVELADGA